MKIAVVIATAGRAKLLGEMLTRLQRQTRAPDHVLVVGAQASDLPPAEAFPGVVFTTGPRGSSHQRNHGLDLLAGRYEVVIFMDDDFIPSKDFMEGAARLMSDHRDVVAASGNILADGVRSAGVSLEAADALIAADERRMVRTYSIDDRPGAYGCNMIVRMSVFPSLRFDENLPLYGWLEDWDLSARLGKLGRIVATDLCNGVHLCVKAGRTPGRQFGYSQVANPLYLASKGTMAWGLALQTSLKCLVANAVRTLAPEAYVDRQGRLMGNLRGIADLILGRLHPLQVLNPQLRATFAAS